MSRILIFNAGSSSLKYAIYDMELNEKSRGEAASFEEVTKNMAEPTAIGHRLVHGGDKYFETTLLTAKAIQDLNEISQLAPLHNPPALGIIGLCLKKWQGIKNFAVFDTAYYKNLPIFARLYALPLELSEKHKIKRYGFHGISHEYTAKEAAKKLKREFEDLKIITVHLGAGCSVTAHRDGRAYDTSMGFTPLEGLVMATRSGDIDPGVLFYLHRKVSLSIADLEELLNKKSGLLGVSGFSENLSEVIERAKSKKTSIDSYRCGLALEIYAYRVKKYIGAYAAAMGGLDTLVFTGRAGEKSQIIRRMITNNLEFLGGFEILVIPTNEELQMAREVKAIIDTFL